MQSRKFLNEDYRSTALNLEQAQQGIKVCNFIPERNEWIPNHEANEKVRLMLKQGECMCIDEEDRKGTPDRVRVALKDLYEEACGIRATNAAGGWKRLDAALEQARAALRLSEM